MNEKQAVRLCIKYKDPVGFEYLVEQFKKEAYYHALVFTNNHDDALDACQECFLKAFKQITELDKLEAFYPWFYTILRNHCINISRRNNLSYEYKKNQEYLCKGQLNNETPDIIVEKKENQRLVWKIVTELSDDHKEILILKYVHEYSYDEIADLLNIARGTVMSRLYYARKQFQKNYLSVRGNKNE